MPLKNIPLILLSEKLGYEQYVENKTIIVKKKFTFNKVRSLTMCKCGMFSS